jgi:peptidoglycan/xylan/chitin deacetylase (PgdA/CDA1 family)
MSKHEISTILLGTCVLLFLGMYCFLHWPFYPIIVGISIWLVVTLIGSFALRLNYHLKAICSFQCIDKTIAITFDDGPSEYTHDIIKLLDKFNFSATFFCIGKNIEKYPEVIVELIKHGHQIANHTYLHKNIGFTSAHDLMNEINLTDKLIENFTSQKNQYFRPPFGVSNPNIRKAIKKTKHTVIGWNIRSLDTTKQDENKIFHRIKKRIKPGSIVLLHDTSNKSVLVLERLLNHLKQLNYQCKTIDELIKNTVS